MQTVKIDKHGLNMEDIRASWGELGDQPGLDAGDNRVIVNTARQFQEIEGIGGAFNELGWCALASLDETERTQVLQNLFDKNNGAGFTFCRFPIGASDFVLDAYSLNDCEDDFNMERFNIDRDMQYLIPYIRAAQQFNPELKFHASPWSPPWWMKTNKSMTDGGNLMDSPEVYEAYALYFCRFVQKYEEQGIRVDRVLIQNEPDALSNFPSCRVTEEQMVKFAVDFLHPAFMKHNIKTEIWGGTFRTITGITANKCLQEPEFRKVIGGIGVQYCIHQYLYDMQKMCGDKKIMHTESVCYEGKNSWEQSVKLYNDFIGYINAGCTAYTYWNMVLDQIGSSPWGWKQNSLISIHTELKTVTYNPDFHIMRLISSNVRPGARRIESFCFNKRVIAFENADKKVSVFISNLNDREESGTLVINGKDISFRLPPQSINAIII